jgi:hypothetical protein
MTIDCQFFIFIASNLSCEQFSLLARAAVDRTVKQILRMRVEVVVKAQIFMIPKREEMNIECLIDGERCLK